MSSIIRIRRGTSSQWASSTRVLQTGELGIDTTLNKIKAGNGSSLWSALPYLTVSSGDLAAGFTTAVTTANEYTDEAIASLSNTLPETYVPQSDVGNVDGVAPLDENALIPDSYIPSTIARDSELFSGSYDDLTNKPILFDGSYNNLTNLPTLFSGSYSDLSNKPSLFSGSYDDLTNKPTIPSLTGYATETYVNTAVSNLVNSAPSTLDTLNELATALGNDANFSTTITNSIGGKVSKSGGDTITAATAATKGLIIQGAASQTANLQEWQNSSGTVLASISPTGTISTKPVPFSGNLSAAIISVTDTGSTWFPGTFSFRSDSNGTPRFSFTAPNAATEALVIVGNSVGVRTVAPNATFHVSANAAANIGAIIQGTASQTADLQQWQNSAGTVLSKIDSDGAMYTITPSANTNTTQVATTAYVQTALENKLNITEPSVDYYVTNSGSGSYTVNGVTNGLISFDKGKKYRIHVNATGHPFWIQTVSGGYSAGNVYNTGITNNGTQNGHILVELASSAPEGLYYACQFHSSMAGAISVKSAGVGVTTNSQSGSYTLSVIDSDKIIEMSGGGTLTITDSTSFPVGFIADVIQTGSSQVSIAGNGFTPNATPGLKLRTQWSSATLIKRGTNSWVILGDLSA